MPYIPKRDRGQTTEVLPFSTGELNYAVTILIIHYLVQQGLSYQTLNDIRGAVGGALQEFERRVVARYEDMKIRENGDVYPKEFVE